jgi:hypothetical protein
LPQIDFFRRLFSRAASYFVCRAASAAEVRFFFTDGLVSTLFSPGIQTSRKAASTLPKAGAEAKPQRLDFAIVVAFAVALPLLCHRSRCFFP